MGYWWAVLLVVGVAVNVAAAEISFALKWPGYTAHCHVFCDNQTVDICQPTDTCKMMHLSSEYRRSLVMSHNKYRRMVAIGKTQLPQAADMMYVTHDWNAELAAQILVSNCNDTFYAKCRKTSLIRRMVLNTYIGHTNHTYNILQKQNQLAINAWFAEVKAMTHAQIQNYTPNATTNATALVSAEVLKIGCGGAVDNQNRTYIVCAYFPAPRSNRPLYAIGTPCSAPSCEDCTPYAFGLCNGPSPYMIRDAVDGASVSMSILGPVTILLCALGHAYIRPTS